MFFWRPGDLLCGTEEWNLLRRVGDGPSRVSVERMLMEIVESRIPSRRV